MTHFAKTLLALALAAGAGTAGATHVAVTGSHHDFGSAFVVDAGAYDLGADADVDDALTVPHASLIQWSSGPFDYYKVTVAAGSTLRLDIDYSDGFDHNGTAYDLELGLWKANGTFLKSQDDDPRPWGFPGPSADPGSSSTVDSWMETPGLAAGTYVIGVANSGAHAQDGGWLAGGEIPGNAQYQLNVSVASAVPEPAMLAQLGAGLLAVAGVALRRRDRSSKAS